MSRANVAKRDAERAHVTVDSGMGRFYQWFAGSDRRYRARELVYLARVGFDFLEQKGKEPTDVAVVATLPASPSAGPGIEPAQKKEPAGFDELVSFGTS